MPWNSWAYMILGRTEESVDQYSILNNRWTSTPVQHWGLDLHRLCYSRARNGPGMVKWEMSR